ncbi:protein translocase subunit SecF, partial [Acidobacteria bacterium AH-259-G07]|nr:protein translocase subunit SecF [Acidobacteria bacterium AH-259-G07]
NVNWLGLKWIFIGLSLILMAAGAVSMVAGGLNLGVDFTGGTLVYVRFKEEPQLDRIRRTLSEAGLQAEEVIRFDNPSQNAVQIRMARVESEEQDLTQESNQVFEALRREYDQSWLQTEKLDLNNVPKSALSTRLQELNPENLRDERSISDFAQHYDELAGKIIGYRTTHSGIIQGFSGLDQLGLATVIAKVLQENFYLGGFRVISVESVGPKVGRELRTRARAAILVALLLMLCYIAIRFWPIYGLAALVALFHDVFITVGAFSITNKEISLPVVAALLTLIGYSINDTIVVFDRVRENLRLMRQSDLATIINRSINQTLNRTIMTSGMTFLAVFSLYVFGGQVLNGFSFALVVGVIIGTYSSVAIASPIVLWWQNYSDKRKKRR